MGWAKIGNTICELVESLVNRYTDKENEYERRADEILRNPNSSRQEKAQARKVKETIAEKRSKRE